MVLVIMIAIFLAIVIRRQVLATIRFVMSNAPIKTKPECGDIVWWIENHDNGCTRYHGTIDALNEKKKQFMTEGSCSGQNISDLIWCRYYQSWEYEESRGSNAKALEKARLAKNGWKKCP